jgi:hypothetical protein
MARITNAEKNAREKKRARVEKAFESLTGQFSKLLRKHVANIAGHEGDSAVEVAVSINAEGHAVMRMGYRMTVQDSSSFPLDDGQENLPLTGDGAESGEADENETPGTGEPSEPA